ncbi:hypothetical protein P3L10_000375 [Capsicum annuum]
MSASLWNPRIEVQQNTACRLKIQKGSNILPVGWRVDPILYGDTWTRLFIHFQVGNTSCFNTLCPGFVIVNTMLPLDLKFVKIQQRGDPHAWEIPLFIERDLMSGNWWFLYGQNNEQLVFGLNGFSLS